MAVNESKEFEINKWLCTAYGNCKVPAYEVNHETLEILNSIMRNMKQQRKSAQLTMENVKKKVLEYFAEGQRMNNILQCNGIGKLTGASNVTIIASISCLLGLKNSSTTGILLELASLYQKRSEVAKAIAENSDLLNNLSSKTISAFWKQQKLKRIVEICPSKRELFRQSENTRLLELKLNDYKKNINLLEAKLQENNVKSNIHADLVEMHKHVQQLKNKLMSTTFSLRNSDCLPRDELLAQEKIKEAQRELQELEKEFSCKIEMTSQAKYS